MSEWKEYKLGDFIKVKHGFAFSGEFITSDETDRILVTPGNFHIGGGFKSDKYKYYDNNDFPQEYILHGGDIVVTMTDLSKDTDTLGYSAKIPFNSSKIFLHNQRIGLLHFKSDEVWPDYVYWLMRTREYQSYIVGSASGTSIMHTSPSRIESYRWVFPPLKVQKRIAGVLSSLDDKIDLLNRENATLEALAETLFRHYFIENPDPTWKEGKVSNIAIHCKDSINPQKHSDEFFLHYSIPAYDNGKRPTEEQGQYIQSNKYVIPQKSILFSKLNPHKNKRVWLVLDDVQPNAICSTEFQIVKPQNDQWLYFLYEWLTYKENYDEIASGVSGTSGSHQRIDPKVIFDNECLFVDDGILAQYNEQIIPIFKKIKSNQQQMQTMVAQHDTLLPRLMSGEVKVGGQ